MTETTVQVSEIPEDHTLDVVAGYFSQCGRISSIKLQPDPNKSGLQIAIITFVDDDAMETALKLSATPPLISCSKDDDDEKPEPIKLFEPIPLRPVRMAYQNEDQPEQSSFFAQLQSEIYQASKKIQERFVNSGSELALSETTTMPSLSQRFSRKLHSLFSGASRKKMSTEQE
ncbi:hypothetical protein BLNAU_13061 [Blattamonas nauphoetae]|uniref:RRM domain-containing protein n=1 Tax=Blattamonas nauphoetae TaxID=2049346 RepID=A0ABQ9XIV5_9EUKA|nr:hypothetical protein BLNAU_13061 [Blattamonas nauphoetae]